MAIALSIPARINILGNPSDGNEGDFATISTAVNLYAGASAEEYPTILLRSLSARSGIPHKNSTILETAEITPSQLPFPYDGKLNLVKAAFNRLYQYSQELRQKVEHQGICLSFWSEVPRQSGLGGSSLFVLLTLGCLREFYDLDRLKHNDYILAELTQRTESLELGITCGFADRYVPLFGGIAYLDYRGKLHHHPIGEEPLVTFEKLDKWVRHLPILAISTGIQHHSGDVHGKMRPRYLEEHQQWINQGGSTPPMVQFMQEAWKTAWKGKIALLSQDWETFGQLMNENHKIVDQMMHYCGFRDGAGWANNMLIDTALKNGALGAKLTGAGSGGSVFALTQPGQEKQISKAWKKNIREANLTDALVYYPKISRRGLAIIQRN